MKKRILSLLSMLLALSMLIGIFAACGGNDATTEEPTASKTEETTSNTSESESDGKSDSDSDSDSETAGNTDSGSETVGNTESDSEATDSSDSQSESGSDSESDSETSDPFDIEPPALEGEYAEIIKYANEMANGVNVYYGNGGRKNVIVENTKMSFDFNLSPTGSATLSALKNTKGKSYIENTMDVFVKMTDGKTYIASESTTPPTLNMFRLGTYYYEVRFWGQEFLNEIVVENELQFDHKKPSVLKDYADEKITDDGSLSITLEKVGDPQVYFSDVKFSTEDYNYFAITIKIDSKTEYNAAFARCYIPTGEQTFANEQQVADFYIPADGEYHTFYIPIYRFDDYTGEAKMLRLDLDGKLGDKFIIKELKAVKGTTGNAPSLSLNRLFHTYSDKLQQVIQLTAQNDTTDIEKIGMYTKIAADTVDKLIVKDGKGTHDTLEGVDWDTAEYVGFDIKDVGIFGYILLPDETSGKLTVTLEGGNYIIEQSRTPDGNAIYVPTKENDILNTKDFYMGQRIYTDETHTFDAFLEEAYCERNPLPEKSIHVSTDKSTDGKYLGYNALRGAYEFTMPKSNFSKAYYNEQNKHFNVYFSIRGDEHDRKIYVMSSLPTGGELECAVVLNKSNMLLPVDVEVCKNFNDGAEDLYTIVDAPWSETFFPMVVKAEEKISLNLLHLYQNWGRAPLKQLSSIQFPMPYYHLSTGTTESNCILPWYLTEGSRTSFQFLPDFRAMSAPMWPSQPQHVQAGIHEFLQYTDADGNYSAAETVKQNIISSGPTYAEVVMDYVTDDGKMKLSYTHMEMPQTDENRTYYTMTYEVLEDISFKDFRHNFAFYSVRADSNTDYERVGYLDEDNEFKVRSLNHRNRPIYYVLGDECPYFSLYYSPEYKGKNGYTNCAFLISDCSFIIGGEESDARFALVDYNEKLTLTLDLDEVTFKAGDKFTINAILLPWGSEKSNYELEDINVRQVRENSLLNPLTLTAEASCRKLDTAFLPTARSTDGLNAEFTISGGFNTTEELKNITYLDDFGYVGKYYATIRLKGFTELVVPALWEKVDGEWVRYNLSSNYYPDSSGYTNSYDGYAVDYEDGFFTYSFVIDMTDAKSRTFRFSVDRYEAEVEPPFDPDAPDIYGDGSIVPGLNYIVEAKKLYEQARKASTVFGEIKLSADEKYVTLNSSSESKEGYFFPFSFNNVPVPVKTGQYVVIKYRLPESNPEKLPLEIFSSTYVYTPLQEQYIGCSSALIKDGEWHVLVIDLAKMRPTEFAPYANGAYYAKFLRIDPFYGNTPMQIDIEYIAMDDSFEHILEANNDLEEVTYYQDGAYQVKTDGGTLPEIEVKDPIVYEDDTTPAPDPFLLYFSPKKIVYASNTNGASGKGETILSEDEKYMTYGSNAEKADSYYHLFQSATPVASGQYLVIKYMTPRNDSSTLQFYVNNTEPKANGEMMVYADSARGMFIADGSWHITIIDLSKAVSGFTPGSDGVYYTSFFRFDPFNKMLGHTDGRLNIGFIGFTDDLEAAIKYDRSVPAVSFFDGSTTTYYSTETGDVTSAPENDPDTEVSTDILFDTVDINSPVKNWQLSAANSGKYETGRYMLIKYNTTSDVSNTSMTAVTYNKANEFEEEHGWLTVGTVADISLGNSLKNDGNTHFLVIDLSRGGTNTYFAANENGQYYFYNAFWHNIAGINIEYAAFAESLEAFKDYEYDIVSDGSSTPAPDQSELVAFEDDIVQDPAKAFVLYNNGTSNTGRYLVFKYRFDSEALNGQFQILTATVAGNPKGNIFGPKDADGNAIDQYINLNFFSQVQSTQDGSWHIAVIDLSDGGNNHLFVADSAGKYCARYVYINMAVKSNSDAAFTVDYLAFADSLDDIRNYVDEKGDTDLCIHTLTQNGNCVFCGN